MIINSKKESDLEQFYIDLEKLANKYSIDISENENIEYGKIRKRGDKVDIFVNPTLSDEKKRFVIAHELAHFFLGHLDIKKEYSESVRHFDIENSDILEQEANMFASQLLVPNHMLKYLIYVNQITDIDRLSKIMRVPKNLIITRIEETEGDGGS